MLFKGLIISGIFTLGIAVGCSQQDGTTATVVPDVSTPTVADTTATNDQVPRAAATDSASPTVISTARQATPRQVRPQGRGFVPLDNPTFLAANETEYFGDEELVLGVESAGEVRAYPVRMLRYHHIVNDTIGGEPLLVTY